MRGRRANQHWSVVLDTPNPRALARFYAQLLDWTIRTDEPLWVTIAPPGDGRSGYLAFQAAEGYVAPVWPAADGRQQMMLHLDVEVEDLSAAVEDAVALGARVAEYQPQDDVRVMLDPDGHPFCLWIAT